MHANTMNLRLGDLVQHPSGEIGMIVKIREPTGQYRAIYNVEWYNPTVSSKAYTGSGISEYDVKMMRDRYLFLRNSVYGYKNR